MVSADLFKSFTGSFSDIDIGSLSGTVAKVIPKNVADKILGSSGASVNQNETKHLPSQPANTPDKNFNQDSVTTDRDAYRFGNGPITGVDPLVNSRVLGEKEDTIASISLSKDTVLDADSPPNGDVLSAYSRFFLEAVTEAQVEKFQIVETFTAFYTFFYGKRPPVYNFRGTLLNDENFKWTNDLMFFYENFLRGTQSVQLGAQAIVSYDERLVSGFLLNMNIQQNSVMNKGASFSFDVLVVDHVQTHFSLDISDLIQRAKADLEIKLEQIQQQISMIGKGIPSGKVLSAYQVMNEQQSANSISLPDIAQTFIPTSLKIPTPTPFF
jgi:hypothetical protein